MTNKPSFEEDIDIADLIITLWNNKWKLFIIILIITLLGTIYLYFKDTIRVEKEPIYETKIELTIAIDPYPLSFRSNKESVFLEFKNLFNSEDIFKKWKNENLTEITLSDFTDTKLFEKSLITKSKEELFKFFFIEGVSYNSQFYIVFKLPKLSYIDDIYNYSKYISDYLDTKYYRHFVELNEKLDLQPKESNFIDNSLEIFIYKSVIKKLLLDLDEGSMIVVNPPTKPILQQNPKELSIKKVLLFVFFGTIIGIFSIFLLNFISLRRNISKN